MRKNFRSYALGARSYWKKYRESTENYQMLWRQFVRALRTLEKILKTEDYKPTPYSLPWYLVLGPENSGKTSLLLHSGLNFHSSEKELTNKSQSPIATENIQWWFTEEAVFLEAPGRFLMSPQNKWRHFVALLKRFRRKKMADGIIVVIDFPLLTTPDKLAIFLGGLKQKIKFISQKSKQALPIYLLFSQCDKIIGFNEYFADLGPLERLQYWGITLPQSDIHTNTVPTEIFLKEFYNLLRRLHQRVIFRLQQESALKDKELLKDFPVQLEMLKDNFIQCVYQLGDNLSVQDKCPLRGIFYASSLQSETPINKLIPALSSFAIVPANTTKKPNLSRPFFVHYFLKNIVASPFAPQHPKSTTKMAPFQFARYSLAFVPALIAAFIWTKNFQNQKMNLTEAASLTQAYVQNQNNPTADLTQVKMSLNNLKAARIHLQALPQRGLLLDYSNFKSSLIDLNKTQYTKALSEKLCPQIFKRVEEKLMALEADNPAQIYMLLKFYLMFDAASPRLMPEFTTWLQQNGNRLLGLSSSEINELTSDLKEMHFMPAFMLNQELTTKMQNILNTMPYPLLTLAVAKAEANASDFPLFADSSPFANAFYFIHESDFNSLYSAREFAHFYNDIIPRNATQVAIGNNVLGKKKTTDLSNDEVKALTQEVRDIYFNDYLNHYRKFLNNLQIKHFNNFDQAEKFMAAFAGEKGAFLTFFHFLQENTSLLQLTGQQLDDNSNKAIMGILSKEDFTTINQFALTQSSVITKTETALNSLAMAFNRINHDANPNNAALIIAQNYIQNPYNPIALLKMNAEHSPPPVKDWLNTIADESLNLILNGAHQQIATAWQKEITPFYQDRILNRYPLTKNSSADITLEDFRQFFAPNGMLARFFNQYLKPFIDTSKPKWQFLTLQGENINVSNEILEQFMRASIISRMFFTEGTDTMGVRFFLQAQAFPANLQALQFHNGSFEAMDDYTHQQMSHWLWPAVTNDNMVTLQYITMQGQRGMTTTSGDWAWFRLFDKAHITPTGDPKRFELTFDLDNNVAKYELMTPAPINPFIAGIMDKFFCPSQI